MKNWWILFVVFGFNDESNKDHLKQVETLENLLYVTDKIHGIVGVKKTTTQVIEKELSL